MNLARLAFASLVLCCTLGAAAGAQQTITVSTAGQLAAAIPGLSPGDTLLLEPGVYAMPNLVLQDVVGAPGQWITIRAKSGRPQLLGTAWKNVLEIRDCAWLRIEDLDVTHVGGMSGIDAVKFLADTSSHDVTLSGCRIHTVSGNGISSQADLVERLRVLACEIDTIGGCGIYLGFTSPLHQMIDTEIRSTWIHDVSIDLATGQPTSAGYGIQVKALSRGTQIVDCVLEDAGGTDRAAIALYYPVHAGNAPASWRNRIAGNLIKRARKEGIYVCNGATIENNVIVDTPEGIVVSTTDGCAIDRLDIRHNTVFGSSLRAYYLLNMQLAQATVSITDNVGAVTAAGAFAWRLPVGKGQAAFARNAAVGAVYAPGVSGGWFAAGSTAQAFVAPSGLSPDLRPKPGGPLIGSAVGGAHPRLDYAGRVRAGVGAAGAIDAGATATEASTAGLTLRASEARSGPAAQVLSSTSGGLAVIEMQATRPETRWLVLVPSAAGPDPAAALGVTLDAWSDLLWSAAAAPYQLGFLAAVNGAERRQALLFVPPAPVAGALTLYFSAVELDAGFDVVAVGGDARLCITP